jgi:geranylgeranylglycerol-phosphate geranylgeranyltransferase
MTSPGTGAVAGPSVPRGRGARAYVRLLRLHFAPISLAAGLAGMVVAPQSGTLASVAVGVAVCAFGYGIGQVINDFADREADAVNAPDRPFVTGELHPGRSLAVAIGSLAAMLLAAAFVAPAVDLWVLVALAGHLLYAATKRLPLVGNLVNGADLAVFTLIGAAAGAPNRGWLDVPSPVLVTAGLVALAFTGFSVIAYFKDIRGDRAAGYRTLPVAIGAQRARWFAIPFPLAAVAGAAVVAYADPGALGAHDPNLAFTALLALAAVAFAVSVVQVVSSPVDMAYEALLWVTRGLVLYELALGALHRPALFLVLLVPLFAFMEATLATTRPGRQA